MPRNNLLVFFLLYLSLSGCSKKKQELVLTQSLTNKNAAIAKAHAGATIKIACEGTSLTYGEDIAGTDTTSEAPGFINGPTRAIYQYPQSMAATITTAKVVISMRGYPGDRTTEALTRWQDSTNADICIIEYGTNDAYNFAGYASWTVPVGTYKTQLEQLVQRRLDQGAWVILCISPQLQSGDVTINAYRSTAMQVAREFSLDAFDVETSISQVTAGYSDVVHFNSNGYRKWGVDMAAFIYQIE
jgi:lysophospholipase L1-like esterase